MQLTATDAKETPRSVRPFHEEVNRLVHQLLFGAVREPQDHLNHRLVAQVRERPEAVVVTAAIPGVDADGLVISVDGTLVTIRGTCEEVLEAGHSYGSFMRCIELPCLVDDTRAEATLARGVLTLTLPKRQGAAPRSIPDRAE